MLRMNTSRLTSFLMISLVMWAYKNVINIVNIIQAKASGFTDLFEFFTVIWSDFFSDELDMVLGVVVELQ